MTGVFRARDDRRRRVDLVFAAAVLVRAFRVDRDLTVAEVLYAAEIAVELIVRVARGLDVEVQALEPMSIAPLFSVTISMPSEPDAVPRFRMNGIFGVSNADTCTGRSPVMYRIGPMECVQ